MQKYYIFFWSESQKYMDIEDCYPVYVCGGEGVAVPCELIDGE